MAKPRTRSADKRATMWSYKAGEKRNTRVRVFAWPAKGNTLWIDYREDGKRKKQSLGHADKERAKRQADETAARLRASEATASSERPAAMAVGVLTLRTLFDNYVKQRTPQKSASRQEYDKRTLPMFIRVFGATRDPASLDVRDWENYIRRRRTGQLAPAGKGKPVRNRIIEQDLRLLRAVLNWATKCRDASGRFLLARNPLDGLKAPKERNPVRAVLSAEQFKALRAAATEHSTFAERFVMLAWYTGRRSSSIRQLRWSDIDVEAGTIRWRAETDKVGKEACRAMHPELGAFLKREQKRDRVIGDAWLFPSPRRTRRGQPLTRDGVCKLWQQLAAKAYIPKGQRIGWHSFRRAFANALRDVPLRELMDLCGWETERMAVEVYQQANLEAQRKALERIASA